MKTSYHYLLGKNFVLSVLIAIIVISGSLYAVMAHAQTTRPGRTHRVSSHLGALTHTIPTQKQARSASPTPRSTGQPQPALAHLSSPTPTSTPTPNSSIQGQTKPVPSNLPTPTPTTTNQTTSTTGPTACAGCWLPTTNTTFQWQLQGTVDQSYAADLYDIDGFDNSSTVVASLHNAGHKVACYIDAGSWENWRSDASQFPQAVMGKVMDGWANEKWLDIRQISVLGPLLQARITMCKTKGFNAIEFDNVDGYNNTTGFPLQASDQLTFNRWLANQAHKQSMAVLLKNDPDQAATLLPYFDAELDEQCFEYQECDQFVPFITAGKPVFEVEYNLTTDQFCSQANKMNFFAQKKNLNLDPTRTWCRS